MVEKAYRVDAEGNQIEDTTDYRIEVMAMIAAILA